MLFNSFEFLFVFLPIAYVVFWTARTAAQRFLWLTITGYAFYASWNPYFCFLMLFTTLVSFTAGVGLSHYSSSEKIRKTVLIASVSTDLLVLAFFKYASFFVTSLNMLLVSVSAGVMLPTQVHIPSFGELKFSEIVLPVGISFYTFHSISYIVDVYRRQVRPTRNFLEYSSYISLFSQLVAGPIVRFRQIEEDLQNLGRSQRTRWMAIGISYFIWGLLQKVLIADPIAVFVNPGFDNFQQLSTAAVWLIALGYAFQLYFDFAGYSNMAIGLGYLFGIRIPINFNSPYQALNPVDFWRRWHISLSTCLRDYVYIPLGGSRFGSLATYRNLLLTMLIGGLWHGANWTFVFWGAYHGLLLCVYRLFPEAWDRLPSAAQRAMMFFLVLVGWVVFRSPDLSTAIEFLSRMFVPAPGGESTDSIFFICWLLIAAAWSMLAPNVSEIHQNFRWRLHHTLVYSCVFGACIAMIASSRDLPFLYFQF